MKLKRALAALLAAALLALGAASLAGCGPDHEKVVREGVTAELESIKNMDEAFIQQLESDPSLSAMGIQYGIDMEEFFRSYLEGFDYRIDEVKVEGDAATVAVALTCKSYSGFEEAMVAGTEEALADPSLLTKTSDEINQIIGQLIMDAIADAQTVEGDPLTLTYELEGSTWTPTPESEQLLSASLLAN